MKVQQTDIRISANDTAKSRNSDEISKAKGKSQKGGTIFAGDLNLPKNKIEQKRKEAQEKAMQVVADAFANEKKIDYDLDARRSKIAAMRSEIDGAQGELSKLEKEKNALKETYGITEDSQEQKDLELLEKQRDSVRLDSKVTLTEEDRMNLEEINKKERTEYQKRSLEYDDFGEPYRDIIAEAEKVIKAEIKIIQGVKLERLKSHEMIDAGKAADAVEKSASNEIVGMLQEEAKEHIDEVSQEKQEEAAKKAKEKKAEEEKLQEIKDKAAEMEALAKGDSNAKKEEEPITDILTEDMVKLEGVKNEVQSEIQNIVDKMNLVIEDIKGAAVDTKA